MTTRQQLPSPSPSTFVVVAEPDAGTSDHPTRLEADLEFDEVVLEASRLGLTRVRLFALDPQGRRTGDALRVWPARRQVSPPAPAGRPRRREQAAPAVRETRAARRPPGPTRPIRPGIIVREALAANGPLSIAELHRIYKGRVADHNRDQPRDKRRKAMPYPHFYRYAWQMRHVGLIQNVGEKPISDHVKAPLLHFSDGVNPQSESAFQVLVDITSLGLGQPELFLTPFKGSPAQGPSIPPPALIPPPTQPGPSIPTITLPATFSQRSVPRIVVHLEALNAIATAIEWPEEPYQSLESEVQRILDAAEGWLARAEEVLGNEESRDSPNEDRLETLQDRIDNLQTLVESLQDEDLSGAQDALESI